MWLQREKGLAVIEKMLGLMFGLCEPSNNDKIFGKNLTYWHWFEASKELKDSMVRRTSTRGGGSSPRTSITGSFRWWQNLGSLQLHNACVLCEESGTEGQGGGRRRHHQAV